MEVEDDHSIADQASPSQKSSGVGGGGRTPVGAAFGLGLRPPAESRNAGGELVEKTDAVARAAIARAGARLAMRAWNCAACLLFLYYSAATILLLKYNIWWVAGWVGFKLQRYHPKT